MLVFAEVVLSVTCTVVSTCVVVAVSVLPYSNGALVFSMSCGSS